MPRSERYSSTGVLQPDLFDTEISEVEHQGQRLILRRNEATRYREQGRREDKLSRLRERLAQRNAFVQAHRRANPKAGLAQLQGWIKRHRLHAFVSLTLEDRRLQCTVDEEAMAESALLDGCYLLETDVSPQHMDTETVDARYLDLQQIDRNFRTLKTGLLEVRPIFLRKAARTKAHVFIALLALKLTRLFESHLHRAFGTTDDDPHALTLDDALTALSRITYLYYPINDRTFARLPRPDATQSAIFSALGITFPNTAAKAL